MIRPLPMAHGQETLSVAVLKHPQNTTVRQRGANNRVVMQSRGRDSGMLLGARARTKNETRVMTPSSHSHNAAHKLVVKAKLGRVSRGIRPGQTNVYP